MRRHGLRAEKIIYVLVYAAHSYVTINSCDVHSEEVAASNNNYKLQNEIYCCQQFLRIPEFSLFVYIVVDSPH